MKWDVTLNSKENGSLDIGSLDSFILALLYKWKWGFFHEPESLWVKVIKCLHGDYGHFLGGSWPSIREECGRKQRAP